MKVKYEGPKSVVRSPGPKNWTIGGDSTSDYGLRTIFPSLGLWTYACYRGAMSLEQPILTDTEVRNWLERSIPPADFRDKRVLVIVPDATRTAPLPLLLDGVRSRLSKVARSLDVLIALGTHPPLGEAQIGRLLGIDVAREAQASGIRVFNHEWNRDQALCQLGVLSAAE